jgi:hypothetical protein
MPSQPFEESAENRRALEELVQERRKNIEQVIGKLEGLRSSPEPSPAPKRRKKSA